MRSKLALLLPVLLFFVLVLAYERAGPNSAGVKLGEIEQLWTMIPIHPSTTEVDSSRSSAGRKAHVSKVFKSNASYAELKNFYLGKLKRQDWQFDGERQLTAWGRSSNAYELEFLKGEYKLSLEYAGDEETKDWDYAIGIYWYKK